MGARVPLVNELHLRLHIMNDDMIGRQTAVHNMTEFVRADPCAPVRTAYEHTLATNPQLASLDSILTSTSVESVLRRKHSACFPCEQKISDISSTSLERS